MNGDGNGAHHRTGHRGLEELEDDRPVMAHNAGACLDQLDLKAGDRPVGQFPGYQFAARAAKVSFPSYELRGEGPLRAGTGNS